MFVIERPCPYCGVVNYVMLSKEAKIDGTVCECTGCEKPILGTIKKGKHYVIQPIPNN